LHGLRDLEHHSARRLADLVDAFLEVLRELDLGPALPVAARPVLPLRRDGQNELRAEVAELLVLAGAVVV
jgi:hypothetical protein